MTEIFDSKIFCKKCDKEMVKRVIEKRGMNLRAVECPHCKDVIIHPADLNHLEQFKDLKGKTYNVKLRVVGNSHAISIPKEIVNFIQEMNHTHDKMRREMDEMVRLCFDDFDRLSLHFSGSGNQEMHGDHGLNGRHDKHGRDFQEDGR